MVNINDALGILYRYRGSLTRQQIKTIAGQMKHGDTVAAIRGLYKILDRAEGGDQPLQQKGEKENMTNGSRRTGCF